MPASLLKRLPHGVVLLIIGSVIGIVVALLIVGHLHPTQFEYRRILFDRGEWWRAITGSFTHMNETHLIHNVATTLVLLVMFAAFIRRQGLAITITLLIMYALFCGLLLLDTDLTYYRGLSGPAHGMWLILGITLGLNKELRLFGFIVALAVILKVAIEQYTAAPIAALWDTAPHYQVMEESHLYGLLAASISSAIMWRWLNSTPSNHNVRNHQ